MSETAVSRDVAARSLLSRRMGLLLTIVAIAVLPLIFTDTYWRTNLTICAINVLLALGLDFILGYTGQLNLGHSAFYGLGAYVSTLLIVKIGVPFWAAFLAAVAFSGEIDQPRKDPEYQGIRARMGKFMSAVIATGNNQLRRG